MPQVTALFITLPSKVDEMKGMKTGGRLAGTPNLITREVKERLLTLLNDQMEYLYNTTDINELRARNEVIRTILPFLVAKVGYEVTETTQPPVVVKIHGNI